ncbi:hypothetical protein J3B02_002362 [Coemansia erecta]|nr:hypothetical protein J3B02_002362 [Coemansia erecta]
MHRAYRLHSTIMNIFCRGAMYVVAPFFVPDDFINVISRYGLQMAELTYQEIRSLVEHISNNQDQRRPETEADAAVANSVDLLKTLRFVCTESENAVNDFCPWFHIHLPDTKLVRTRFGSYVEPLA